MTDKKTEFVEMDRKQEHKCETCRHSIQASVYPKLWCFIGSQYTDQKAHCARWQVRG